MVFVFVIVFVIFFIVVWKKEASAESPSAETYVKVDSYQLPMKCIIT